MSNEIICRASPSLALIKYWGKSSRAKNRTATTSIAVTLGGISTETRVSLTERADSVVVDGIPQPRERFEQFFHRVRQVLKTRAHFKVVSSNNFPSSAGLASSSSGFAALACACVKAVGKDLPRKMLSDIARTGSASAARAVFEGFVLFPAGARSARLLYTRDHWPDFRVVIVIVSRQKKPLSSTQAMENTRLSSPFYRAWLRSSSAQLSPSMEALKRKDIEQLGRAVRLSFMRMHAAIMGSDPPILYWSPATIAVIRECQSMRDEGIGAWETIDAGPQVKILCERSDAPGIMKRIKKIDPSFELILSEVGKAPHYEYGKSG